MQISGGIPGFIKQKREFIASGAASDLFIYVDKNRVNVMKTDYFWGRHASRIKEYVPS
jgi:hypothetical protein